VLSASSTASAAAAYGCRRLACVCKTFARRCAAVA
jgi:hypothetical protein